MRAPASLNEQIDALSRMIDYQEQQSLWSIQRSCRDMYLCTTNVLPTDTMYLNDAVNELMAEITEQVACEQMMRFPSVPRGR